VLTERLAERTSAARNQDRLLFQIIHSISPHHECYEQNPILLLIIAQVGIGRGTMILSMRNVRPHDSIRQRDLSATPGTSRGT
jgi:hypothetical protein